MLPANKLFDNPEMSNGDEEANHGLESGKEYKTFNQRICAAYGK